MAMFVKIVITIPFLRLLEIRELTIIAPTMVANNIRPAVVISPGAPEPPA